MSRIKIDWLHDTHYCETCGSNYAEGAAVYVDDVLVLELEPVAHCYDGASYTESEVFRGLLMHLGHEVVDHQSDGEASAAVSERSERIVP